ncbi:MAG: peptidyl-prolyl cis-trans isomerase [Kiritimatiellia bacterium]
MFIYHFTNLIKSKILWGFLALLMVFAFVVMDSCTGPAPDTQAAGWIQGDDITRRDADDASQVGAILKGQGAAYLPQNAQIFSYLLRAGMPVETWPERRRMNWKLLAAHRVAQNNGMTISEKGAERVLETMFAGPDGAFNPALYRAFLSANNYTQPKLFETTFANLWLPSQTLTMSVFNAMGWASPMEQDFVLSARFDPTTLYAATLKKSFDPATLKIEEATLTAWYAAHKDDYSVPEQRVVTTIEIPVTEFAKKVEVVDIDAMQYYDDHSEEFQGSDTNGVARTLPFEEVKDKAIAKVRAERALEQTLVFANETLVSKVQTSDFASATKDYGKPSTATLRQDRPFGFQKVADVMASAFEMDVEETPVTAIAGDDRVYLLRLEKVIPQHIAPFAEVKASILDTVRKDTQKKRLNQNGQTLRSLIAAELAKGSTFDAAIAACKTDGLTATTAMTFVVADTTKLDSAHGTEIIGAASSLGEKTLSEPIVTADDELLFVYIAKRTAGDPLAKATAKTNIGQNLAFNSTFQMTADWLNWNLDRAQPTSDAEGENPILTLDESDPEL